MVLEISPEDIQTVSQFMGKDFFDPERTAILRTLDPCDIQACPGSGKTTAVVAKLVILEEKLTRNKPRYLCFITHKCCQR